MAVKKVTSRTRSTTKAKTKTAAKTTRSTTKRVAKAKTAAKKARVTYTPAVTLPAVPANPEIGVVSAVPAAPERAKTPKAVTSTEPRPSQFTGDHFIHVIGPDPAEGMPRRPGKWMIFVTRTRVDALWEQIRRAVVAGRLGHAAKVSTALPDPLSPDPKKHMICVYTANEHDAAEVRRVRGVLRGLGITWKIPYKSDAPARAGQFEGMAGPAAKYYE